MSTGVEKSFRMLREAHSLLCNRIDVKIGFIETHNRKENHELLDGLPNYKSLEYSNNRLLALEENANNSLRAFVFKKNKDKIYPKLVKRND